MIERIVFLQPRTVAGRNYQNADGAEQTWTPWFALLLGAIARDAGLQIELIDARTDSGWMKRIAGLRDTDALGVSVMTGNAIRDALQASQEARERGAKVIWGGPHVSLFPEDTLREAPVDAVLPGFGVYAFSELVQRLAAEEWPYRDRQVVVPAQVSLPALSSREHRDVVSGLALDLISSWDDYLNRDIAIADRTANLITSEGCLRKCTYCSEPRTSYGHWLTYDVQMMVALAARLRDLSGANGFKLHDPNFFHDLPRANEFALGISRSIEAPWAATMHPADLAMLTAAQLGDLSAKGLARVLVGLESPDAQLVRLAGKQYDPAQIPELVTRLARARIRGMFTFIVGWPGADPGHYARTIQCAKSIREIWSEHQAKIHFLEPWPGTPLFSLMVRRGFQAPRSLEEWANIDYYQARHAEIHDAAQLESIRLANRELSPYVDA
jgi:radical SAM superfamily enzyme YgiQ (UPF0313 family)